MCEVTSVILHRVASPEGLRVEGLRVSRAPERARSAECAPPPRDPSRAVRGGCRLQRLRKRPRSCEMVLERLRLHVALNGPIRLPLRDSGVRIRVSAEEVEGLGVRARAIRRMRAAPEGSFACCSRGM